MKKLLVLFVSYVFCVSCSYNDDTSDNDKFSATSLSPPSWIQGDWKQQEDCESFCHSITFTSNSMKIISWGGLNVYDIVENAKKVESSLVGTASLEDSSESETSYSFIYYENYGDSVSEMEYDFVLIDEKTLEFRQGSSTFKLKKM